MTFLLRIVKPTLAISSTLVFASVLAGQMMDGVIQAGNLEADGQRFILYVEDKALDFRVDLAGTRCFDTVPDWLCPDSEFFPVFDPPHSQFYLERVTVPGLLSRCH